MTSLIDVMSFLFLFLFSGCETNGFCPNSLEAARRTPLLIHVIIIRERERERSEEGRKAARERERERERETIWGSERKL